MASLLPGRHGLKRWWYSGLCVAVLAVGVGPVPAVAAPVLGANRVISSAGSTASEPAVAVAAGGRMLAAWVAIRGELTAGRFPSCGRPGGYGTVEARLGRAAHGWRGVQVLGADGEGPLAAVGANGTAAVAWCSIKAGHPALYVAVASPGRPFGRARLVPTGGRFPVGAPAGLEVQPDGTVVLVWSKTLKYELTPLKSSVQFALLRPNGGRPVIGAASTSSPGEATVSVAEAEDGDVLLAFPAPGSAEDLDVAQLHPTARTFTPPQTIEPSSGDIIRSAGVSAGPGGAAVAFTASGEHTAENEIAEQQPDGTFGPASLISQQTLVATGEQFTPEDVRVAFPADREPVAVWSSMLSPSNVFEEGGARSETVMAAVRAVGAVRFQAPVQLSDGTGRSGVPVVAAAAAATVVLWVQMNPAAGSASSLPSEPWARRLPRCARYQIAMWRRRANAAPGAGATTVAGSGGNVIAGWVQNARMHVTTLAGGSLVGNRHVSHSVARPRN